MLSSEKFNFKKLFSIFSRKKRNHVDEIYPDEVLIDSSNLPDYDIDQFEGRLEKPISIISLYSVFGLFLLLIAVFLFQAVKLQIVRGEEYRERSEKNLLRPVPVFAGRGVIFDRNGLELAWNISGEEDVARRKYATTTGMSHLIGYVQYPSKDSNGFYYREDFEGVDGVEEYYNDMLKGESGSRLVEVDARGNVISQSVVRNPVQGSNVTLSIDSRVQSALYNNIKDIADRVGFAGGAGIIMDVRTGEVLAVTSYPEYGSQLMSDRYDQEKVKALLQDTKLPFLDRAIDGLYTPGSIVKPFMALAALTENIIQPSTVIVTQGFITIPNPYDSTKSTIFKDWKNHGAVDMRQALAVSSDAYFYAVGGGYKDQKGLGIKLIDKYLKLFGFGSKGKSTLLTGKAGTIPTPEWKKLTFNEDWFVGDTYNTSIGQYGFQVTPVQIVKAVASVANGGTLLSPTVLKDDGPDVESIIDIPANNFEVVRQGMRLSVNIGTSKSLSVDYVDIAAKSGTAELGVAKDKVNSWMTGFWPYEEPKYAFAVILEKGSVHNLIGAGAAMRQLIDWMNVNTPEYFVE